MEPTDLPTSRMDLAGFSFTHLLEFSKLALGFAIELADYKPEY
jgi:hypothetical protein